MGKYLNCLKLNLRALKLALCNKWLSNYHYARSYNKLAESYDQSWLTFLKPVTDELLNLTPEQVDGNILDLGCGTGYTTKFLANRFPKNKIIATDISSSMISQAKEKFCADNIEWETEDMLGFLKQQKSNSVGLIISGWSIGYSKPSQVITEIARILKESGSILCVVNSRETLLPIFDAFKKCMAEFPQHVNLALWPKYPKSLQELEKHFTSNNFEISFSKSGSVPIQKPDSNPLDWLLNTGILAGFDQVLPLETNAEVSDYFEQEFQRSTKPLEHSYIMIKAIKST